MIIHVRETLLVSDFGEAINLLQAYPPSVGPHCGQTGKWPRRVPPPPP